MRPAELRWSHVRVGLFVAMSLLLAFGLLAAIGIAGSPFERRATLRGLFVDVSGLAVGSPVEMGGVVVGEVSEIALPELASGRVPVRLSIDRDALERCGRGSEAFTSSHALVGQRFIGLTTRQPDDVPLKDGDEIRTGVSRTVDGLIDDARRLMGRLDEVATDLRAVSAPLARAAVALDSRDGTLGRLLHEGELHERLSSAVRRLDTLAASPALHRALRHDLPHTVRSLQRAAQRVDDGEGLLGRMTSDGDATQRLDAALANVETVSGRLLEARGTLGTLINDQALMSRVDAVMVQLDSLLTDVRRNPQRYIKLSPF